MVYNGIPSGKHTKNYGKSPCLMGKSTISMAIFNCFLYAYQRVKRRLAPISWLRKILDFDVSEISLSLTAIAPKSIKWSAFPPLWACAFSKKNNRSQCYTATTFEKGYGKVKCVHVHSYIDIYSHPTQRMALGTHLHFNPSFNVQLLQVTHVQWLSSSTHQFSPFLPRPFMVLLSRMTS